MLDRPLRSIVAELQAAFGVGPSDALAAVIVGRSLNRSAGIIS